MKKIVYVIPTVLSLIIFFIIIKPGIFNMIPFLIHQSLFRGIIKEITFVYIFDFVFCVVLWYIIFKFCKLVIYRQ